jgi:hypothetical protein
VTRALLAAAAAAAGVVVVVFARLVNGLDPHGELR